MSKYNNKSFTQMKNPFFRFSQDEWTVERLRRGWLLIEDLLKALNDL